MCVLTLFGGGSAAIPRCRKDTSGIVDGQSFEGADLVPLGLDVRINELEKSLLLDALDGAEVRAVFFFNREDLLLAEYESFLRNLVRRGHHLGLNAIRDASLHQAEHFQSVLSRRIAEEQSFAESITGKDPIFLSPPREGVSEGTANVSHTVGVFIVNWKLVSLDEALDLVKNKKAGSAEAFMDAKQLHCAFDRTSCDFVGRWELYRKQCQDFRSMFYRREKIDLYKFVLKNQRSLSMSKFMRLVSSDEPIGNRSFLDRNRLRVQRAYERVDQGTHMKEIMLVLFSLSDDQVDNRLDESLRTEMRDFRLILKNATLLAAVALLLLYVYVRVRRFRDGDTLVSRKPVTPGTLMNQLAQFSKAE